MPRVIISCPMVTCVNNTASEPKTNGFCTSESIVTFDMIEAKSADFRHHYGKILDTLVCSNYKTKPEYARLVVQVRCAEGEEATL